MAFGETLKNARTQKGLSPSDVAEATHMMVQIVEDLEGEDFRRIAAPIYGRGFVKLYAELLELEPEPLIRDFMDLYTGARAPAVRMKAVEESPKPLDEASPRMTASVAPQRQPVQARPSVRPLSMPLPESESSKTPAPSTVRVEELPPKTAAAEEISAFGAVAEKVASDLIVEPEGVYAESDEPDLFHPQPVRRKPVSDVEAGPDDVRAEDKDNKPRASRKSKLPIFKVGGRLESSREPEVRDEALHARRMARIQKFAEGFNKLCHGVERRLTTTLSYKRYVAIGCAGLLALVCMGVGIHMLFKLTGGANVKAVSPAASVEKAALPPDMYVD